MQGTGRDGFTYMGLLVVIMVIGISTTVVTQTWKSVYRVEREKELLWTGHQIRNAIRGYYEYRQAQHGGAPGAYYPSELKDLVSDPGRLGAYSWMRRVYDDPITGEDWVLIRTPGGIKGVRSSSDDEPLKKAGFDVEDSSFINKTKYSEWEFVWPPQITTAAPPVPGSPASASGAGAGAAGGGTTAGGWEAGGWETGGTTGGWEPDAEW